jgi:hypothetical protein
MDEYVSYLKNKLGEDVSDFELCLSYEVSLEELLDVRERIYKSNNIINKKGLLTKGTARLLWAARFSYKGKNAFDVLFDATDIPQGRIVSNIIIYDHEHYEASIAPFVRAISKGSTISESNEQHFLGSFVSYLKEKDKGVFDYLDERFGELRAPRYLKDEEVEGGMLHSNAGIMKYYGRVMKGIKDDFPDITTSDVMIWAISFDGALLIGKEEKNMGHPTLTGFKPARIAGELKLDGSDTWIINSKSGRYSSNYENSEDLLQSAIDRFLEVFAHENESTIVIEK